MNPVSLMRYFILFLSCIILISCNNSSETKDEYIGIGTFNIEWLGDGVNDKFCRNENDYKNIAENQDALNKILKYLPDMNSYILTNSGSDQNLAIISKKFIDVNLIAEYSPLEVRQNKTRPGLIVECKADNFDWIMMNIHLKSTSRYDSTYEMKEESRTIRLEQTELLNKWIDSIIAFSSEKDIIIVGDFNDSPIDVINNTLTPLVENDKINFISKDLNSCKYDYLKAIDHIVISKNIKNRYIQNSVKLFNFYDSMPDYTAKKVSDHCPVIAKFNIYIQDND